MNTQFQIYITTNNVNGKQYIGLHSKSLPTYFGSGTLIKQAIKKYGKSNFKKEILAEVDDVIKASELERYYIQKFNAVSNDNFYNLSYGGELLHGRAHSIKTINKISKSKKKNYETNSELRYKVGSANRGKKISNNAKEALQNSLIGRKMTQATKEKIRTKINNRYQKNGLVYPDLINIEIGEVIQSGINLSGLAKKIGVSKGNLYLVIKGVRKTCKNWKIK